MTEQEKRAHDAPQQDQDKVSDNLDNRRVYIYIDIKKVKFQKL